MKPWVKNVVAVAAASIVWGQGPSASAKFFDVQAMIGKRWYEFESDGTKTGVQSQEIDIAAHIAPIPVVPVGFGVGLKLGELRKEDLGSDVSEAKVFEAGLDITGWVPLIPIITPYARLNIPLIATSATKSKVDLGAGKVEYASTSKLSGFHLNAGVMFSPIPLVGVLVESQHHIYPGVCTSAECCDE